MGPLPILREHQELAPRGAYAKAPYELLDSDTQGDL
jgi:hypothetical protein